MKKHEFTRTFDVTAPVEKVWAKTIDIERWPEWTTTVTRARRLDEGPITAGSKVLVAQPRLPPTTWTLTTFDPPRTMILRSGGLGVRVIAHHALEATPSGCRVTLSVRFEGLLAGLVARLTRDLNHNYLRIEAAGLKKTCEGE